MIAYIRGTVTALEEDTAVIETSGIGYLVSLPGGDLSELSVGDEVKIRIYMAVREDAVQLFGFLTQDELTVFRLLIGVSGIGPKGALSVLSTLSTDELRFAVLSDDAASISKVPGIGKKTAQKLILDLKDKLDLEQAFELKAAHASAAPPADSAQSEAVEALTALGYPAAAALKAVRKAASGSPDKTVEQLLKEALKAL